MSPSQDVSDKAAAIGIEVVPIEKFRSLDTEDESFSNGSSRSSCEGNGRTRTQSPSSQYPTVPPRRSRMTRREYVLAGIVVVALTGLVVGLAVALSPSNPTGGNASTESATPPSPPTVSSPPPPADLKDEMFPEDKSYIDNACSSSDDLTLCRVVCDPAHCCSADISNSDNDSSCLFQHTTGCLEYAKCHAVLTPDVSRPAPRNLQDLCLLPATTATDDSLDDCREACQPARCCFDDSTESCLLTNILTCLDYAPCQVLNNKSTLPPEDTSDFLDVCASSSSADETTLPSEECEEACQAASCCWSETDNCLQTDLVSCLSHAPCNQLVLPPPSTIVNAPTSDIQDLCSLESMLRNDGSFEQCLQQCQDASCCTATSPEENCFADDPLTCLLYQPCAQVGGSVPPPRSDLQEICNGVNNLDSGALQTCIDSCQPSACCVADGNDNCVDDGNAITCPLYKDVCEPVLALSKGSLSSPPSTLSQICSVDNLSTVEGYAACLTLCVPAACCNSLGNDNCLLDNISTCGEWNIGGCYLLTSARGGEP